MCLKKNLRLGKVNTRTGSKVSRRACNVMKRNARMRRGVRCVVFVNRARILKSRMQMRTFAIALRLQIVVHQELYTKTTHIWNYQTRHTLGNAFGNFTTYVWLIFCFWNARTTLRSRPFLIYIHPYRYHWHIATRDSNAIDISMRRSPTHIYSYLFLLNPHRICPIKFHTHYSIQRAHLQPSHTSHTHNAQLRAIIGRHFGACDLLARTRWICVWCNAYTRFQHICISLRSIHFGVKQCAFAEKFRRARAHDLP